MEKIVFYTDKNLRDQALIENPGLRLKEDLISSGTNYLVFTDQPYSGPVEDPIKKKINELIDRLGASVSGVSKL
jgi:hypothetical protein